MTHNEFDLQTDLILPLQKFFIESYLITTLKKESKAIKIKDKYFQPPQYIQKLATYKEKEMYESV